MSVNERALRSNAGMANRRGRHLALSASLRPPPQLALWLRLEPIIHSRSTTQTDTSRRMKRLPTVLPRCCVDQALHRSTEHATQWHSDPQLHQHHPLQLTVDLRSVSPTPNGTSSLATDRRSLHYTAVRLYAAANTAAESRHQNPAWYSSNGTRILYNFRLYCVCVVL